MFWRPRRPSLLMLLLAMLGLGCLIGPRRCRGEAHERRARARRKFKEGLEILFAEDEPAQAPPDAGASAGE